MKQIAININLKKVLSFLIIFFSAVFLFLNIQSSQTISPLFSQIINNDKNASIAFLKSIKTLPVFKNFLEMNKNIYGKNIILEIYKDDLERKYQINKLKQALVINSQNPEILYNLYLLYKKDGDKIKAEEYLQKAKKIDPNL